MGLLKDKYSKSPKTRSKLIVDRKVIETPIVSTYKTTEQNLSEAAKQRRAQVETKPSTLKNASLLRNIESNTLFGKVIPVIKTAEKILTLHEGESIKDIIISHHSTTGSDSTVSLHWGFNPIENLTLTYDADAATITDSSGGLSFRLFTLDFTHNSTMSLADNGLISAFQNINKTVYFYAICSDLGPTFTVIK